MYDLSLTDEQRSMRDAVRGFVRDEIKPAATRPARLEPFEKPLLTDLLAQAVRMGLRTLALSEARGGSGADLLTSCVVMEELAAGDVDLAVTLGTSSLVGQLVFDELPAGDWRDALLRRFVDDDGFHLAFAGRDPDAAIGVSYQRSPPASAAPCASATEQASGEWLIEGEFPCVVNAPVAGLMAVEVELCRRDGVKRAGTALVPVGTSGLAVTALACGAPGAAVPWRHGACGRVRLAGCRLPAQLVFKRSLAAMHGPRASVQAAAMNVGIGQAAFDAAVDYARLRRQGGRSIIEHEAIGALIGDMAMRIDASRAMVRRAAWGLEHPGTAADDNERLLPLHRMASAFTAEMMREVATSAAECFGAMGVMRDMPMQQYVHDTLVFAHGEVSPAMARLVVAGAVAGGERPAGG